MRSQEERDHPDGLDQNQVKPCPSPFREKEKDICIYYTFMYIYIYFSLYRKFGLHISHDSVEKLKPLPSSKRNWETSCRLVILLDIVDSSGLDGLL